MSAVDEVELLTGYAHSKCRHLFGCWFVFIPAKVRRVFGSMTQNLTAMEMCCKC